MEKDIIHSTQKLAKLVLTNERFKKIHANIQEILGYINILEKLDTSKYSSTYNASGLKNVNAKDEPDISIMLTQNQVVSNAPENKGGYIVVPRVLKS